MPSVSLLNTEWRKVCDSVKMTLKNYDMKEERLKREILSLYNPQNKTITDFHMFELGSLIREAREEYTQKSKNHSATDSELHKLWENIKKLEEIGKKYDAMRSEIQELHLIHQKLEEASKKKNGFFESAVGSSSGESSSSSGNSIDDTILTDPWGY